MTDIDKLKVAAETGFPEERYKLAKMYEKGDGVEQDDSKAFDWYLEAAKQGHVDAQFWEGNYWNKFAENSGSQVYYEAAAYWFELAAEQGHADAQGYIGEKYMYGEGVTPDTQLALNWLLKAAEQGNAGSQYNLGVIYENGDDIPIDNVEALKWFTIAATNDEEFEKLSYEDIEKKMAKEEIDEAKKLAKEWLEKH